MSPSEAVLVTFPLQHPLPLDPSATWLCADPGGPGGGGGGGLGQWGNSWRSEGVGHFLPLPMWCGTDVVCVLCDHGSCWEALCDCSSHQLPLETSLPLLVPPAPGMVAVSCHRQALGAPEPAHNSVSIPLSHVSHLDHQE